MNQVNFAQALEIDSKLKRTRLIRNVLESDKCNLDDINSAVLFLSYEGKDVFIQTVKNDCIEQLTKIETDLSLKFSEL